MSLQLRANAKINLGLRIVGRRDDPPGQAGRTGGYHRLHTLFQEIDFGDDIILTKRPSPELTLKVTGAQVGVPSGEENLCLRAAHLLQETTSKPVGAHLVLHKQIPPGAGLGGGSSDAAAVLKGLNDLWQLGLTPDELQELAVQLGADVPLFIRGGLQLGEGIGEVLTPLAAQLTHTILLVLPPFSVDTAWAYGQFAGRQSFPPAPGFDRLITQDPIPWDAFTNDFEAVVFPHHGELAEIKGRLLEAGAVYAGLSGSGSGVYGMFEEQPTIAKLKDVFPDYKVIATTSIVNSSFQKA